MDIFKSYKMVLLISLPLIVFFSLCLMEGSVFAALMEKQHQTIETLTKKDLKARSHAKITIQQNSSNKGRYDLRIDGKGEYAGYKDVSWISEAVIEEKGGDVIVQNSSTKVFSKGKVIFQSEKKYDYTSLLVTVQLSHERDLKPSTHQYPIKGPICDDVTLVHVFNKILPSSKEIEIQKFYLLTDEPKLYHVMIKRRPDEILSRSKGIVPAEKFQLMADLGPLTELASKMVPPTYVWFPKNDLRNWVQYEGMETGYETVNIVAYRLDGNIESSSQ